MPTKRTQSNLSPNPGLQVEDREFVLRCCSSRGGKHSPWCPQSLRGASHIRPCCCCIVEIKVMMVRLEATRRKDARYTSSCCDLCCGVACFSFVSAETFCERVLMLGCHFAPSRRSNVEAKRSTRQFLRDALGRRTSGTTGTKKTNKLDFQSLQ